MSITSPLALLGDPPPTLPALTPQSGTSSPASQTPIHYAGLFAPAKTGRRELLWWIPVGGLKDVSCGTVKT